MSCNHCGCHCQGRLCIDCERDERAEDAFDAVDWDDLEEEERQ